MSMFNPAVPGPQKLNDRLLTLDLLDEFFMQKIIGWNACNQINRFELLYRTDAISLLL